MLPDATRRRAADLLNQLDLLARRKLVTLGEPWQLNLRQLWLWREQLIDIAQTLEQAEAIALEILHDPFALCGLAVPQAVAEGDLESTPAKRSPFNESLIDYALTEYVAVEESALAEDSSERSHLDHDRRLERLQEIAAAYAKKGFAAPANVSEELAALLAADQAALAAEDSDATEMGSDLEEAAPDLTLEERQEIFRECHAAALAMIRLAIKNLTLWVRADEAKFRQL